MNTKNVKPAKNTKSPSRKVSRGVVVESSVLSYTVNFREEPEGGYTVFVPLLPGCITYGSTIDDAREMASDAITGYLECLKKHGEPIPYEESNMISMTISVSSHIKEYA